ncbi:MAG: ATP-binding cassette domain-containing protein [Acidimicrobiales bacterium]
MHDSSWCLPSTEGPEPPVTASSAAVWTAGLVRRFSQMVAVDGLDLRVRLGEIYGFLGPNGAGKSTVVRILCTLLRPSEGAASVAGYDVAQDPQAVRLRIGVALQDAAIDDRQTGRELLSLQGRLYGLSSRQIRMRLGEVLDLVDIGAAIDRRIGTYSGGMKRRIDLAAALIHRPEVLFLDEPTTGLDPHSRSAVWSEVARLNRELGMTIFLTTQYLDEADTLADRVGIISSGRLVAEGTPADLKHSVGHDVIVADVDGDGTTAVDALRNLEGVEPSWNRDGTLAVNTQDGAAALGPVAMALSRAGLELKGLSMRTPTLDDVFTEMTGTRIEEQNSEVLS